MMLKCVMMSPRNVAYTSLANLDNPKIAEHIHTHTHTHTRTRILTDLLSRVIHSLSTDLQNGVKTILQGLSCPYLAFGRYRFRILLT